MTPERWQQIEKLLNAALELDAGQRAAFLGVACTGDEALRKKVEALLAHEDRAEKFIEAPALEEEAKRIAADQARSHVGRQVGPYRILSLIGAGGMGEIYLAQDERLGRKIALKLLPASFTQDQERVRRFEQEARAASALNHPNIITIHEIGQVDGLHYIATEFIEGQTLRQQLKTARLKLRAVLEMAVQVASALTAAHAAGITHRDIKPENTMVRPDGLVKALDFGLAKLTERPAATVDMDATTNAEVRTDPGTVMGTAHYMSPEQARGLKVDGRSDIFSLGVVLYEMIAGKTPFEGATTTDVLASILRVEPVPLSYYSPEMPAELERILAKALEKEREERYQTVKDLLPDLKRLKQRQEFEAELERSVQPGTSGGTGMATSGGAEAAVRTDEMGKARTTSNAKSLISQITSDKQKIILVLAVLIIAAATLSFYFSRRPALTEADSIILADFVNTTGDTVFDSILKQALAIQLEQSPFLNIFPDERVRETLRYMNRPPGDARGRAGDLRAPGGQSPARRLDCAPRQPLRHHA